MKKKKILFPFVGDSLGGSHIASVLLIKNLLRINYDFEILIFTHKGELAKYLTSKKIPFQSLNLENEKLNTGVLFFYLIKNLKIILEIIKKNDIKIIHTNDLRMHYLWSVFSFFFNRIHIWHQHSAILSRKTKILSKFSSQLVTVSNFAKESFHDSMSKRAIIVGNPFENPKRIFKSEKKIKNRILYIGNNNYQKRSIFFIELAKELALKKRRYEFHMIGKFNFEKEKLDQFSKININIHAKSFDLSHFFINSDILVAPSINEGFGRTLIEAMFYKVLVIASNSGAHSEILKDGVTGRLVKTDSLGDFKKVIDEAYDNDMSDLIISNAYSMSRKAHNISNYMKKIKDIYEEI